MSVRIIITMADNGYQVSAGCLNLVFERGEHVLSELGRWMTDPVAVERQYQRAYAPPQERSIDGVDDGSRMSTVAGLSRTGLDDSAGEEAPRDTTGPSLNRIPESRWTYPPGTIHPGDVPVGRR